MGHDNNMTIMVTMSCSADHIYLGRLVSQTSLQSGGWSAPVYGLWLLHCLLLQMSSMEMTIRSD